MNPYLVVIDTDGIHFPALAKELFQEEEFCNTCSDNHEGLSHQQVSPAQGLGEMDVKPDVVAELSASPAARPRRGRPAKAISREQQEQLCLLVSSGLSRRKAAAHLGIDHTTVSRVAARDEEFAEALASAELATGAECTLRIVEESRKNWRAAAWFLTHCAKAPPPQPTAEEQQRRHAARLLDLKHKAECRELDQQLREEFEQARQQRAAQRRQAKRDQSREEQRKQQKSG